MEMHSAPLPAGRRTTEAACPQSADWTPVVWRRWRREGAAAVLPERDVASETHQERCWWCFPAVQGAVRAPVVRELLLTAASRL